MSVTHIYQGRRVLLHPLPHPISEVRIIRQSGSSRQAIVKISPLFKVKYSEKLHPDKRLIVCRNPLLAHDRARTREALLHRTKGKLEKVKLATSRPKRRLKGKEKIGLRVGKVIGKFKMAKHFLIAIEEESFSYERDLASIAEEAALDGIYVLRTSVPKEILATNETVGAYKSLSQVERAFRSLKSLRRK